MAPLSAWSVPSASRDAVTHLVMRLPDGALTCTCEAATYGRMCRHRVAVLFAEGEPMTTTLTSSRPSTPDHPDQHAIGAIEAALAQGDLSKLSGEDRTRYLLKVCQSLSLNPLMRPLQYIVLSNKLTLYATRDATDQLRKIHGVSVRIASRERIDDLYIVQAEATDKTGRTDTSLGIVSIAGLRGEALANQIMKCETKAKRRVTLSICGLGMLDETEVESVRVVEQEQTVERPRLAPPAPSPAALSGAPDFSSFWRDLRTAGWDPEPIQAASMNAFGTPVAKLSTVELAELRDAALNGRLMADGEGVWRIVPVGEPAAR